MGTLKTSLSAPSVVDNDLGRLELRRERNRSVKLMDELSTALERWKKLKMTPHGQLIIEVADLEIKQYEENLSKPTSQMLAHGDIHAVNETRAEWRGCLSVWKSLKYNLVEYENKVNDLKQMLEKEESDAKILREKKLANYR